MGLNPGMSLELSNSITVSSLLNYKMGVKQYLDEKIVLSTK